MKLILNRTLIGLISVLVVHVPNITMAAEYSVCKDPTFLFGSGDVYDLAPDGKTAILKTPNSTHAVLKTENNVISIEYQNSLSRRLLSVDAKRMGIKIFRNGDGKISEVQKLSYDKAETTGVSVSFGYRC